MRSHRIAQVRLQLFLLQRRGNQATPGIFHTVGSIVRNEGVSGLWKGTTASLMRSITYGGLRFGLYKPIKTALSEFDTNSEITFSTKIVASLSSGAIASLISNPLELVKVRMQANESGTVRPNMMDTFAEVYRKRGVRGLWAGSLPSISRGAILTASQCVTYDETKARITDLTSLEADSLSVHFLASIFSGLVSTTITNPVDVVKTYMFVNRGATVWQCVNDIFLKEGPRAFLKGWLAAYMRLGPKTTLIFLFSEQLRDYFHIDHV